jgi:acyl dehydratase
MASPSRTFAGLAVGSTFRSTGEIAVTAERIKSFAAEFDPQPIHLGAPDVLLDPSSEVIASGWHTAALSMRLVLDSDLPLLGRSLGVGVEAMSWRAPVRPGDRLRLEGTITEFRPSRSHAGRDVLKFRIAVYNQAGELTLEATHVALLARRGASPIVG